MRQNAVVPERFRMMRISVQIKAMLTSLLFLFAALPVGLAEPQSTASQTILFLCPHNAAKSVIAEAWFNELAEKRGLPMRGASAGLHPSDKVSTAVVALLRQYELDASSHVPRRVTHDELKSASRVISLGCDSELTSMPLIQSKLELWDDVPPPIHDLPGANEHIRGQVEDLVSRLEREQNSDSRNDAQPDR